MKNTAILKWALLCLFIVPEIVKNWRPLLDCTLIIQWLARGWFLEVPVKGLDGLGSWDPLRVMEEQVLLPNQYGGILKI